MPTSAGPTQNSASDLRSFSMASALRVEITRGAAIETEHAVICAVADADGRITASFGDIDRVSPVRSAVKPLQALPLVVSGAADAIGVSDAELAIACGSHNGEPGHVEIVTDWLARLGLSEEHLLCGRARPMVGAWDVLDATDITEPTRPKHNCSGKHTGFLTLALHLGVDPSCYLDETAPVQRTVLQGLADRFGLPRESLETAVDGCGAPVACVSPRTLARGLATLLPATEENTRVLRAIGENPWCIGGTGRFDTRVTEALKGNGFTKVGAEGNHVAVLRDPGITIAMKALSGDGRAGQAAMFQLLTKLGALDPSYFPDLADAEILNSTGAAVGRIHVRGLDDLTVE
jgi:L-asparaginase II